MNDQSSSVPLHLGSIVEVSAFLQAELKTLRVMRFTAGTADSSSEDPTSNRLSHQLTETIACISRLSLQTPERPSAVQSPLSRDLVTPFTFLSLSENPQRLSLCRLLPPPELQSQRGSREQKKKKKKRDEGSGEQLGRSQLAEINLFFLLVK